MTSGSARRPAGKYRKGLCSVVCLTYNHARFAEAAIRSIAEQDYLDIEIVVVDDGSTDGNAEVVQSALDTAGRPHSLIVQENTGNIAMNCNRGLAVAAGEFVSMMSLDDLLLPGCFSSKIPRMTAEPTIAFIANARHATIDETGRFNKKTSSAGVVGQELQTAKQLYDLEYRVLGTFFVQGAVIRRDVIDGFGGYDEDLAGDDLILRTKLFRYLMDHPAMSFEIVDEAGMAYRRHPSNIHRQAMRQLRTVVDWRNRYYPGRKLPKKARSYIERIAVSGNSIDIERACALSPEIRDIFTGYTSSWRYRIDLWKRKLRGK